MLEDLIGDGEEINLALELVTVVADFKHKKFIESQELLNNDKLSQVEA